MLTAPGNLILQGLSSAQELRLRKSLVPVALPAGMVLYEAERAPASVTFITSGLASIVTYMGDGASVEIGIVGNEGMPESDHLLGTALGQTKCFMQIAGTGLRMRYGIFEQEFSHEKEIRNSILNFIQYQGLVLNQLAACNKLHETEERLARWLLMAIDRTSDSELRLTQDFLAQMLGSRRSSLTIAAGALQQRGLIEYSRGHVRVADRSGLEKTACECYQVTIDALQRYRHSATKGETALADADASLFPAQ